uniref:Uncharacterized protein n=1 Tax=Timspurckia oligopyrenoides TaxID=708627 RepID=A0A7S0ZEU4_9RHOD
MEVGDGKVKEVVEPAASPVGKKGGVLKNDDARNASNSAIKEAKAKNMRDRMNYLLSQSKIFEHFMGNRSEAKAKDADATTGSGRRRMTEKEEDDILLADETYEIVSTTRLSAQPPNIKGTMRPYQVEGLNFLIGLFERGINGILADEMGLGKTLQTISMFAFLRHFRNINGPHLVIAPKSTLQNWVNEITRFCPEIRTLKLIGSQDERKLLISNSLKGDKFDVLITSYEMVVKEKSALNKFCWRYLVIDEAHRIKNENSILSQIVRIFDSQNRLLITGTPLQNNLRELWALLNFLLPDVFASATDFDSWFASVESSPGEETDAVKTELVSQLHTVLKPFLIRRLKADVATDLPPKKETVLFTQLSEVQREMYKNLLKKDVDAINGPGGDRVRLLNILMQLRKCCNHPYLFDGVEDRSLDPFGEHVVKSSGKLDLLDRLLVRLRAGGHRVLIFSQMTRVLDILEDYCCPQMRNFPYCRIDGSTDGEARDQMIEDFNSEGSDKFIFLLSTRAGGLGINLATADTVILFDSDWNPQVDLQAMDRAHRIGQKKPVNVYRLVTENSVEERILRKAMEKLRLDTIVIQQGRLTEEKKKLGKDEVLDMIRYGADSFFKSTKGDYAEEDLDILLSRSETKTKEMNDELSKIQSSNLNLLDFKLGDTNKDIYEFEGIKKGDASATAKEQDLFFLDVGKRERRVNYDEAQYFQNAMRANKPPKVKQRIKLPKEPTFQDFQFYNITRLRELYELEKEVIDEYNRAADEAAKEGKTPPPAPNVDELLDENEQQERQKLLEDGFGNWTRREFNSFLRGCERHGRNAIEAIAADVGESKTLEEVAAYSKAFWKKGPSMIDNWLRLKKSIEEGEAKIVRREEMERALVLKCERYDDPWRTLDVVYSGNRGKGFTEDEDRWLICMTWKLGYGRWEELKLESRKAWQFRFDWYIKSRTPLELKRRVDALIRSVEKENEEILEAEREAEKRRKASAAKAAARRKNQEERGSATASATKKRRSDVNGAMSPMRSPSSSPASKKRR